MGRVGLGWGGGGGRGRVQSVCEGREGGRGCWGGGGGKWQRCCRRHLPHFHLSSSAVGTAGMI